MGAYRSADNPDRAKAAAGVVIVHVALAALVLSGLTVSTIAHKSEALKVFDISDDVPPPPVEPTPPPKPDESSAPRDEPAPENIRSTPTEVVAPRQVSLPVPLPMSAALAPGQGSDSSAGAGETPGAGTGAGGQGSGTGGGGSGGTGTGTGDGRSPAFPINKIPNRDYRRIAAGRLPSGSASMSFIVTPAGRVTDCRIVASSGDRAVDATLCPLAEQRLRFRPAMDAQRRPIAYRVGRYVVTWDLD